MKIYYKCILMVFCAALSLGLALEQPARSAVSATALPMGEFLGGQALCINNSGQSAGGLIDSDDYHHACLWDFGTSVPTILDRADGHLVEFVNTDGEYRTSQRDQDHRFYPCFSGSRGDTDSGGLRRRRDKN